MSVRTKQQSTDNMEANHLLKMNIAIQVNEIQKQLLDQEASHDMLKSKTDRSIGRIKDQISWMKSWLGGLSVFLFIEILGNILGAW